VGCLALTHFVPPYANREALLAEVAADFAGPVVLGEDLMTFDVVEGTVRHGLAHWSLGGPRWRATRRATRPARSTLEL
jgi:ribonuclease Z